MNKTDLDSLNRAQTDQGRDLLNLSKQITAQTLEYNKLAESNKLYERILGKSETETPDKLSRLVMSSEIFQTEVGKYSTQGGPNMAINSDFSRGTYNWSAVWKLGRHPLYYNGQKDLGIVVNRSVNELTAPSKYFKVKRNTDYRLNIKVAMTDNVKSYDLFVLLRKKGETQAFTNVKKLISGSKIPSNQMESVTVSFNTGEYDEGYFRFDNNGSTNGQDSTLYVADIDLYEGKVDRPWQPSPDDPSEALGELGTRLDAKVEQANGNSRTAQEKAEDAKNLAGQASNTANTAKQSALSAQAIAESVRTKAEAVQTRVTQLAGSWAVKNLNSAGDVIGQINLNKDGSVKINESLLVIGENTYIKNGVIKNGMIANLSADKLTAGTIDATDVKIINLNAKSVTSGTFKGLTFEGGIIRGLNGNTLIDLNNNITAYNGTATIEFKSPHNSLEFNSGGRKAFLSPTIAAGTNQAAFAFGVNDRGEGNPNKDFVGLKIFNSYGNRRIYMIGEVHIVKDSIRDNARATSLIELFNHINDNFKRLRDYRVQNGEGSPGFWDVSI